MVRLSIRETGIGPSNNTVFGFRKKAANSIRDMTDIMQFRLKHCTDHDKKNFERKLNNILRAALIQIAKRSKMAQHLNSIITPLSKSVSK